MTTILSIRPQEDDMSQIVGKWLAEAEAELTSCGRGPSEVLRGTDASRNDSACRANVKTALGRSPEDPQYADLIAYYGHGTRCRLCTKSDGGATQPTEHFCEDCCGCWKLPLGESLIDIDSCEMLRGRVVYAVACLSLARLGHHAVSASGANPSTAYFGYDDCLWIPYHPESLEKLKEAVNSGLCMLAFRDRSKHAGSEFERVVKHVKGALFDAACDVADDHDAMRIVLWRFSFDGDWYGKA